MSICLSQARPGLPLVQGAFTKIFHRDQGIVLPSEKCKPWLYISVGFATLQGSEVTPTRGGGEEGRWKALRTASCRCTARPAMQGTVGQGAEDSFRWFKSPRQDKCGMLSSSACLPLILEIQKAV